jgi:hypothetical protein
LFQLSCCGIYGPGDWQNNSLPIPETCCAGQEIMAGVVAACDAHSQSLHNDGCLPKVVAYLRDIAAVLGGVGLGIALIQVTIGQFNSPRDNRNVHTIYTITIITRLVWC